MHVKSYMLLGNEALWQGVRLAHASCMWFILDLQFDSMQDIFKLVSDETKEILIAWHKDIKCPSFNKMTKTIAPRVAAIAKVISQQCCASHPLILAYTFSPHQKLMSEHPVLLDTESYRPRPVGQNSTVWAGL